MVDRESPARTMYSVAAWWWVCGPATVICAAAPGGGTAVPVHCQDATTAPIARTAGAVQMALRATTAPADRAACWPVRRNFLGFLCPGLISASSQDDAAARRYSRKDLCPLSYPGV